jgi:hypothetical protein
MATGSASSTGTTRWRSTPRPGWRPRRRWPPRDLGGFAAFHQRLFENPGALEREDLSRHAEAAGLAREDFDAILDSGSLRAEVAADLELAKRIGVGSTPYFFINGRPLRGAKPVEEFTALIDEELAGVQRSAEWLDRIERPGPAARAPVLPPPAAKEETAVRDRTPAERLLLKRLETSQEELAAARAEIGKLRRRVEELSRPPAGSHRRAGSPPR